MTIYQKMLSLGVEVAGHESDLYVPVTPETKEVIENWEFKNSVTVFYTNRSNGSRMQWYDIPFAFDPWWEIRTAVR